MEKELSPVGYYLSLGLSRRWKAGKCLSVQLFLETCNRLATITLSAISQNPDLALIWLIYRLVMMLYDLSQAPL